MPKKIDRILDNVECSFAGIFVGNSLFAMWEHWHDRDSHKKQKHPWYRDILVDGIFTCSAMMLIESIKLIIETEREDQKGKR